MKNNNKIKTFLRYNWWKIIGIATIGSIIIGYIGQAKTKIRDDEIIHLFIAGSLKDQTFNEKYFKMFHKEDNIVQINTTSIPYTNAKFASAYQSIFGVDSDLVIVPETHLKDNDYFKASVYKFTDEETSYLTDEIGAQIYKFKEFNIGIKIYDKNDETYNNKFETNNYFVYEETSYLFIDKSSTNLSTVGFNNKKVSWNSFCNFINFE